MFEAIWKFINYWYFRYLLVTELYMVEKWERIMIHIVLAIIFSLISLFNTAVVLRLVSFITISLGSSNSWEEVDEHLQTSAI